MDFEVIIGLEVHVQLKTASKIFCTCSTTFGAPPNTHTCPVCLGMPGVLPVLNKKVVEYALRMAIATNCTCNPMSQFARKNYFYPDLPKGYQISQYELPLAEYGWIEIDLGEGKTKRIGITRIHLEEDAGKLMHDETRPVSYVDLNRTGVPLIEIVSEPDIRAPEEANAYLRKLRQLVRYLGVSDGNMEEGSLRCDANISLRPKGQEKFGTKAELKNMNSFKHVQKALEYEIRRQTALLMDGKEVVQETRLWDPAKGVTKAMRGKEEAHDYRYFPDPDLVPVEVSEAWLEDVKSSLPELPDARRKRFQEEYGLPFYDADVLTASKAVADYYEACVKGFPKPKIVSNWVMVELLRLLKQDARDIAECPVAPEALVQLLKLIDEGTISGKIAKSVLEDCYNSGKMPKDVVEEKGLMQVSDEAALQEVVDKVVSSFPEEVEKYKAGKKKVLGFLVGQVMKETKGQANPQKVNEILRKVLDA